jgi:hypothetical protein
MSEETIFEAAIRKPNPTERAAYLEGACGRDPELRRGVEALVRARQQSRGLLSPSSTPRGSRAFPVCTICRASLAGCHRRARHPTVCSPRRGAHTEALGIRAKPEFGIATGTSVGANATVLFVLGMVDFGITDQFSICH